VALEIVEVVADALEAAGRATSPEGLLLDLQHRDIKPSNIMVTPHGQVKVLDFGIARARFEGRESATEVINMGTPGYMAPERLARAEGGPASDLYSLGVVLWEVLAQRRFERSSPQLLGHRRQLANRMELLRRLRRPLHPELDQLLGDLLAWSPAERPSAGRLVARCAELGRRLGDPPLRSWCRGVLRGLERQPCDGDDELVGSTLTVGGSVGAPPAFADPEPAWNDRTALSAGPIPVITGPAPEPEQPVEEPLPVAPAVELSGSPPVEPRSSALWRGLLLLGVLVASSLMVLMMVGLPERPPGQASLPALPELEAPVPVPAAAPEAQAPPPVSRRVPAPVEPPAQPEEPSPWGALVLSDPGPLSDPPASAGPWGSLPGGGPEAEHVEHGAWAAGLQVELEGDASEVTLVNESQGFPVPGVVPAGAWFVRVRFGQADPVVAGVVELEGSGPVVLRCEERLSWCSIKR